ncbi:hypothetical protein [Providencia rettgeri]|uniref:hypothetical protein n=1 Tax=Providencia rettgeri TaxID=587 RepID=UPI0023AA7D40|nr:hypothetical protein [Providencia rettgeri]
MSLVIIILLIILVPTIPFLFLLKKRKWKFWLDKESLHEQPLFWFLVCFPLVISGVAWGLVSQNYELDISTTGYSYFMEKAKFPLLILTLSPILGAFVTSAHRSLQTFAQINATEIQIATASRQLETAQKQFESVRQKNQVDIFLATKKYIIESLLLIKIDGKTIDNPYELYEKSFTKVEPYKYKVNLMFYKGINSRLSGVIELIAQIKKIDPEVFFNKKKKKHQIVR